MEKKTKQNVVYENDRQREALVALAGPHLAHVHQSIVGTQAKFGPIRLSFKKIKESSRITHAAHARVTHGTRAQTWSVIRIKPVSAQGKQKLWRVVQYRYKV